MPYRDRQRQRRYRLAWDRAHGRYLERVPAGLEKIWYSVRPKQPRRRMEKRRSPA